MLEAEEYDYLIEFMLLRNLKWKFKDGLRIPTRAEVRLLVDECIETVQESDESISIEIGGLLIKRSNDYIDVYVHVGAIKDYE